MDKEEAFEAYLPKDHRSRRLPRFWDDRQYLEEVYERLSVQLHDAWQLYERAASHEGNDPEAAATAPLAEQLTRLYFANHSLRALGTRRIVGDWTELLGPSSYLARASDWADNVYRLVWESAGSTSSFVGPSTQELETALIAWPHVACRLIAIPRIELEASLRGLAYEQALAERFADADAAERRELAALVRLHSEPAMARGTPSEEQSIADLQQWESVGYLDLEIDKKRYLVRRKDKGPVALARRLTWRLFLVLARNRETPLNCEALGRVWDDQMSPSQIGQLVTPQNVRDAISALRKGVRPLGVDPYCRRGLGYSLVACEPTRRPRPSKRSKSLPI